MKKILTCILVFMLFIISANAKEVKYSGTNTINNSISTEGKKYDSSKSGQSALLINSGTINLKNMIVSKSGDDLSELAKVYGINSAIVVRGSSILNITGGTINTAASYSNGILLNDKVKVDIINTNISTEKDNSAGILSLSGNLNCKNMIVRTSGNFSPAVNNNGGSITINSGTYETNGDNSPTVRLSSEIKINDASLSSSKSELIIVENNGNITLSGVKLNGSNIASNNIYINSDNDNFSNSFNSYNSNIIINKGDAISVLGAHTNILLENNTYVNNDKEGLLLKVAAKKIDENNLLASSVKLEIKNQNVNGNIYVDDNSNLDINITNGSSYEGTINADNVSKNINISLSADSSIKLTGDSYINSLTNEDSDNFNIDLNGYSLYVNNEKIEASDSSEESIDIDKLMNNKLLVGTIRYGILGAIIIVILLGYYKNFKKGLKND